MAEPNFGSELQKIGFENFQVSSEGCLHLDTAFERPKSFFKGKYKGLTGVFEIVAKKTNNEHKSNVTN